MKGAGCEERDDDIGCYMVSCFSGDSGRVNRGGEIGFFVIEDTRRRLSSKKSLQVVMLFLFL